mgnify:CR=1 FL=1
MVSPKLQEHLDKEHKMSTVTTYLKEIVYGGSDGIVTTFAVVAGFAGAQQMTATYPLVIVLLFGLANLVADGASMGLSNFLSLRSEQDLYDLERKKEIYEIKNHPKLEREESIEILINKGFSKSDAESVVSLYEKNPEYYADFMMNHELEFPDPIGENPLNTGLATFFAFVTFGFVPLIPYVFMSKMNGLFTLSCIFAFSALTLLGFLRWKVTKHTFIRSVGEVILVGGVSAVFAFIVGSFFKL